MRITTKFIASSVLMIGVTAVLTASHYVMHRRASQVLDARYGQTQSTIAAVGKLEFALQSQVSALGRLAVIAANPDERDRQQAMERAALDQARQQFDRALTELRVELPPEDQLSQLRLKGIRRHHEYLDKLAKPLLSASATEQQAQATARSLRTFNQYSDSYVEALVESANAQAIAYRQDMQRFHNQAIQLSLVSCGIVMLLLMGQLIYLLRPLLRSLQVLQRGADRLGQSVPHLGEQCGTAGAAGSVPAALPKIQLATEDELQSLAIAFNQMGDRLAQIYQELERRVEERTASLQHTNQTLLEEVRDRVEAEAHLKQALEKLNQAQFQLVQTEKMTSLGQLVAGVAHEINNPVSFIQGNLDPAQDYMQSLLDLLYSYQAECPDVSAELSEIVAQADLAFIEADFPRLLQSIGSGAERITTIVRSLQTFSHLDKAETKSTDLHQGLDSALLLLSSRLSAQGSRPEIEVVRQYDHLPKVYCYPGQLNQVFMGLISNAIDALTPEAAGTPTLPAVPTITITTRTGANGVRVEIADNGVGMSEDVLAQIFNPFFTTKPVGSGMGLGLSLSYQIVVSNHRGQLTCQSAAGVGTTFTLEIPLDLKLHSQPVVELPQMLVA